MTSVPLPDKERIEIEYWRRPSAPASDSIVNLVNKLTDAPVLLEAFEPHRQLFERARNILELGAGDGWASCLLKKLLAPGTRVIASDISRFALSTIGTWTRVFGVSLDQTLACRSYEIPLASGSIDLVFAFQSAHHFVAHGRTLREVFRVLKPGGDCLYLHEPTCRQYLYPVAYRRVNLKRPDVPEDVLVPSRLFAIARAAGFTCSSRFDVSISKRGPVELLYYSCLRAVPPLKHILPCTRHLRFHRPEA